MSETRKVVRVTTEDLVTGHKESVELPAGEYLLTTTPPCEAHFQVYKNGTHVITIKGRRK